MNYAFTPQPLRVLSKHLHMGGLSPDGSTLTADSQCILLNGKPWIPLVGEMHFSRNPVEYWEEDILKLKAAGLNAISSYLFWIHHEEREGEFNWRGSRDIRRFVLLCQKHEMYFFLRPGPWVHGECRNGGFPDWIAARYGDTRSDDPEYLLYVRRYYAQVAKQLEGLFFKDGGPIIGFQPDNELIRNAQHLQTLKELAMELGMEVPLYSVTGWGHHGGTRFFQDEFIPSFGGYPEGPWEQHVNPMPPSANYFFSNLRNDVSIGVDVLRHSTGEGFDGAMDESRYPYMTCETGTGIPVTYHRRPIITQSDVGAIATVALGNGNNCVGYFMFKGGVNPKAGISTYNESLDTHYINNFPTLSNDFQAPVSEFGFLRPHYGAVKALNLFVSAFGERLARMQSVLPSTLPKTVYDDTVLRCAVRTDGREGFLFVNNYQRLNPLPAHATVGFSVMLETGELTLPPMSIPSGAYFILPIKQQLGNACLLYAACQPLTKIGNCLFFFVPEGLEGSYCFESSTLKTLTAQGASVRCADGITHVERLTPSPDCIIELEDTQRNHFRIVTLTHDQAMRSYVDLGATEKLIISSCALSFDHNELILSGDHANAEDEVLLCYGAFEMTGLIARAHGIFQEYHLPCLSQSIPVQTIRREHAQLPASSFHYLLGQRHGNAESPEWEILPAQVKGAQDVLLSIAYNGDVAHAFLGNRLIADDFNKGIPWVIGLKRFANELEHQPLTIKLLPLLPETNIYREASLQAGEPCLCAISATALYTQRFQMSLPSPKEAFDHDRA